MHPFYFIIIPKSMKQKKRQSLRSAPLKLILLIISSTFFSSVKFQCPPTRQFRCHNDRVCLPISKRCDDVNNCGDNSDELNCCEFVLTLFRVENYSIPRHKMAKPLCH